VVRVGEVRTYAGGMCELVMKAVGWAQCELQHVE